MNEWMYMVIALTLSTEVGHRDLEFCTWLPHTTDYFVIGHCLVGDGKSTFFLFCFCEHWVGGTIWYLLFVVCLFVCLFVVVFASFVLFLGIAAEIGTVFSFSVSVI